MEIKKTISKYSYRIEAKPGGGFVAYSSDPSMEAVEGATREEVIQQVEAKISAILGKEFPKLEKLLHSDLKIGGLHMKVDSKVNLTINNNAGDPQPPLSQPGFSQPIFSQTSFSSNTLPQDSGSMGPILPAKDTSRLFWQVVGALVAIGALLYFFLRR